MDETTPRPTGRVTFLFTDIEGSTKLWEQHPRAMRRALTRHDTLLRDPVEARGGVVFKTIGDALCAAFSTAPDALAAALTGQRALQREAWEEVGLLRVRMALHSGTVEECGGDYLGPPLNRVARLLAAGHGGQMLLSQATWDEVREAFAHEAGVPWTLRDLGVHRLKDLLEPEHIFQIIASDLPVHFPPLRSMEAFEPNLPPRITPKEREILGLIAEGLADHEIAQRIRL